MVSAILASRKPRSKWVALYCWHRMPYARRGYKIGWHLRLTNIKEFTCDLHSISLFSWQTTLIGHICRRLTLLAQTERHIAPAPPVLQIDEHFLSFSRTPLDNIPCHIGCNADNNQTSYGHKLVLGFRTYQAAYEHMHRKSRYEQRTDDGNQINQNFNDHVFLLVYVCRL